MTLPQLLNALSEKGLHVREYHLRNALRNAHIPQPSKNASGRYVYSHRDLQTIAHYFTHKPPPGRKKAK